ncbi:hypothetical protein L1987_59212 [Smallanthus sonchifolius]|uniref:Uncharacterized protein n=1 Tax=Smallanthus sonchifolius TaxID=185202 RepID=A0ACB9D4Z4_9ASTR|nr:hypothetical protein L1987_59212 [Smallanthus sonchifolius]
MIDGSGSHTKSKDDEQMKKEEYLKRQDVIQLSTICAEEKVQMLTKFLLKQLNMIIYSLNKSKKCIFQIKFHIDVQAGSSPKKVAAKAAISLSVTWVVLDRQMKKDRKYFMEKLTCGILRMKHDNTIEKLREPIIINDKKQKLVKRTISSKHVSYGEMIPVMSKQELSSKKTSNTQKATNLHKTEGVVSSYQSSASMVSTQSFTTSEVSSYPSSASIVSTSSFTTSEVSSSTYTENLSAVYFHQDENDSKNIQPTNVIPESKDQIEVEPFDEQDNFEYSVCSVCEYKRPNIRLKQDFTYTELQEATNGFSSDKYLSEGGFGFVYEGKLKCGLKVAVKQHKDASSQGEKEFKSEVNLGDFGLARTVCVDTDETGVVGTLGYVAPEYAECGKVSTKTDVYSFGVVLLQLITGCKTKEEKFKDKTLVEWVRQAVI